MRRATVRRSIRRHRSVSLLPGCGTILVPGQRAFASVIACASGPRRSGMTTAPERHRQTAGNFVARKRASAALTATGFSCAIQCPDWTTTSVRSAQFFAHRFGEARVDGLASVIIGAMQEQHGHREPAVVARFPRVGDIARMVHVPGSRGRKNRCAQATRRSCSDRPRSARRYRAAPPARVRHRRTNRRRGGPKRCGMAGLYRPGLPLRNSAFTVSGTLASNADRALSKFSS